MIIIETCPECGHDLVDMVLASYPPIPRKVCPRCGWSWTGEPEKVMRVPFGGNRYYETYKSSPYCVNCLTNPANGGSGICNCDFGGLDMHITYGGVNIYGS